MDDFVVEVTNEGVDAFTAKQMWRSGISVTFLADARKLGLTVKDLESLYGTHGPTLSVVLRSVMDRLKG